MDLIITFIYPLVPESRELKKIPREFQLYMRHRYFSAYLFPIYHSILDIIKDIDTDKKFI